MTPRNRGALISCTLCHFLSIDRPSLVKAFAGSSSDFHDYFDHEYRESKDNSSEGPTVRLKFVSNMSSSRGYEDDWDGDSTLGDDKDEESTQSLTSSVFNYTYENGRRYHAFREGQYFMPNDDQEQEACWS